RSHDRIGLYIACCTRTLCCFHQFPDSLAVQSFIFELSDRAVVFQNINSFVHLHAPPNVVPGIPAVSMPHTEVSPQYWKGSMILSYHSSESLAHYLHSFP